MKLLVKLFIIAILTHSGFATQQWSSLPDASSITFISTYDGIEFTGEFSEFTAIFAFDPNQLGNSSIKSTVDVTSVNTNSRDRDQALAERDWFYFSNFPKATFASHQISYLDNQTYLVTGTLQIRDQQREVSFPFEWESIDVNTAHAQASFQLDRRDFNIGTGGWAQDKTIGFNVTVSLLLTFKSN